MKVSLAVSSANSFRIESKLLPAQYCRPTELFYWMQGMDTAEATE